MTDDSNASPAAGAAAGSPSPAAKGTGTAPPKSGADKSKEGRRGGWLPWLLVLLLLAILGAAGWYGWQWQQQQQQSLQQLRERVAGLSQLGDLSRRVEALARSQEQAALLAADNEMAEENRAVLTALGQRLQRHERYLQSLTTTSRSDWQLAEAEYLLRLASQRMLMERSGEGALALLQAADRILREQDDPQLFGVREQLAREMAALQLLPQVDRSGLYLQLAALADRALTLPANLALPLNSTVAVETLEPAVQPGAGADDSAATGLWQKLRANFSAAMARLGDQVRIRHHDQPLQPMLPPDSAQYLRQNIRIHIEQAQLALLREQAAVYQNSLQQARDLLQSYLAQQPMAQLMASQLQQLAQQPVHVELPEIGAALEQLRLFNDRRLRLDPAAGDPQLSAPQEANTATTAEQVP